MARTYEELKAEMAEKRRAAESAKAAAPQVEPAPSAPASPFAVPDYLKPPAALTAPEGLEVFEPAPRAKRIKKIAAPATPSVTRAVADVQPKPQEILKTPEQAAEQVRAPEIQTVPRVELPPDMRREVDWKKFYDAVGTEVFKPAKRRAAEALQMTEAQLDAVAQAQGVSLEAINEAKIKGRTYEEVARANRERGVLGFMPLAEREASFTQTVDDFEKAQRGEASEGIRLKKSGADQDWTGGYVAMGTHTALPEVSKPGEYGHLISETLVEALQKDPKASAFYDLYGRKLATGNTQKYIEERTKDLMDRAGVSASDPDSFDKRQKLRRRAINEILAYKTIGMWTPAVTMQDVQVTEGVEAPGFFASIGPNIELVGINNKGQAVYRQESPLGVLFRAIDIPQEAIVSKLEGRSAAEGIQTGANFLEYAIEHTEGESPYVRYPALAAGFLGSVAMPDLLVGPGMAAKGVKAAKRLYDVRKIAPRVLELLTDVAEARKSKDMAKAKKAEVALRNYTPQIADMLDRYDAAAARRFQMVDPIDEDIFNENVSALLATLDDEGAKALAAERVHLHPSMRKPETAAKLPTKDEPYAAFDELFNTDILEARVSKAKADYLATAPKTVEEHFARYAKGLTRTKLEAYKNAKVITPAELDDLARIVEASTAPALAGNMGQWKQSIQATLKAHPVFGDPKFAEIRKAVYVNVGKSLESRAKSMVGLNIGDLNASDVAAFDRALTAISRNSEARGVAATLLHKEVADQAKVRVQPLELFDDVALSGPGGEPIRLTPGGVLFLSRIRNLLPEVPFKDVYAESVLIDKIVIARAKKEGRDPFAIYEELFPEIRAATKNDIKRYKAMASGGGPAPALPGAPPPTQAGAPPTQPVVTPPAPPAPPAPPVPGQTITLGRARRPVRRPVPAPPDTLDLDVTEGMRLPDEELNLVVPEDIDITAAGGIQRPGARPATFPTLFETEAQPTVRAAAEPTGEVTGEVTQSLFEPTREIPFRRTRAELVRRERELQQRAAGARERFAEFERTERIPEREVTEEMLEPTLKVAGSIEEAEVTEKVPNLVTTPVPKGYSIMPNKGNEYEVPWTAYLSGKDSAAIRAKAAERTDLGVLVTPHSSSILKNVDAYPFFAVDNGVFAMQGKGFSPEKFTKLLDQLAALPEPTKNKLLFVVAPDKLDWVDGAPRGDAAGTLEMFKFWGPKLRERGLPVAFVAQNGLEDMVDQIPWDDFDVLFIGGSDAWKVGDLQGEARQKWNALFDQVRAHGKPIHMGRVSGPERMLQSHARVGSATVDGTMLAVAPDQMMVKLERMLDDLNVQTKSTFDDYLYPETQQAPSAEDLATVARDARVKSFADAERYYPGFVINDTVPGLVNIAKAERRRVWNEITELRKTVKPEVPAAARVVEEVAAEPAASWEGARVVVDKPATRPGAAATTAAGVVVKWEPTNATLNDVLVRFDDGTEMWTQSSAVRAQDDVARQTRSQAVRAADEKALADLEAIRQRHIAGMDVKWPGAEFGKAHVGKSIDEAISEVRARLARGVEPEPTPPTTVAEPVFQRLAKPEEGWYDYFSKILTPAQPSDALRAVARRVEALFDDEDFARSYATRQATSRIVGRTPEEILSAPAEERAALLEALDVDGGVSEAELIDYTPIHQMLGLTPTEALELGGFPKGTKPDQIAPEILENLAERIVEISGDVADFEDVTGAMRVMGGAAEENLADVRYTAQQLQDRIVPVEKDAAFDFVRKVHSKLPEPRAAGFMTAVGVSAAGAAGEGPALRVVGLLNTPSAHFGDAAGLVELSRVASDGKLKGGASAITLWAMENLQTFNRSGDPNKARLVTTALLSEPGEVYKALEANGLRATGLVTPSEGSGARAGAVGTARKGEWKINWEFGPAALPEQRHLADLPPVFRDVVTNKQPLTIRRLNSLVQREGVDAVRAYKDAARVLGVSAKDPVMRAATAAGRVKPAAKLKKADDLRYMLLERFNSKQVADMDRKEQAALRAAAAPVAEAAPAAAKAEAPTVAKPPTLEVAAANAGAPEMVTEDKVLPPAKARAAGNAPLEIPEKDLKETLGAFLFGQEDTWDNPFVPAAKTKVIPKKLPEIPQADANARIAQWKAEAVRQGKSAHYGKGKVVLSLFDASGEWSKPWREAGYTVWSFDIQNGEDISKFSPEYLAETFGDFEGDVYAILAAPPCTNFSSAGARWWARMDAAGETKVGMNLVDQTLAVIERYKPAVWVLENPAGRIKSLTGLPEPTLSFNPHNFGNPYTKRTLLWGDFNPELPTANVFPAEGSRIHKLSGKDKFGRSLTPEGFAYAFFMANNAEALGDAKVIAREMRGVPEDLVQKALDAGHSPADIRTAVEDAFYMEQSPDEVRAILNDLIANPVGKAQEAVSAAPTQAPAPLEKALADARAEALRSGSARGPRPADLEKWNPDSDEFYADWALRSVAHDLARIDAQGLTVPPDIMDDVRFGLAEAQAAKAEVTRLNDEFFFAEAQNDTKAAAKIERELDVAISRELRAETIVNDIRNGAAGGAAASPRFTVVSSVAVPGLSKSALDPDAKYVVVDNWKGRPAYNEVSVGGRTKRRYIGFKTKAEGEASVKAQVEAEAAKRGVSAAPTQPSGITPAAVAPVVAAETSRDLEKFLEAVKKLKTPKATEKFLREFGTSALAPAEKVQVYDSLATKLEKLAEAEEGDDVLETLAATARNAELRNRQAAETLLREGAARAEAVAPRPAAFATAEEAKAAADANRAATEAPAFKAWFGSSKVVNAEGKPLVVYHGTDATFESFAIPENGVAYFTPDTRYGYLRRDSGVVIPAYVSLKRPYYADRVGFIERLRSSPEDVAELKASGYDGVVYADPNNIMRGPTGWGNDYPQIAVFEPNQIKSATGNVGTFSAAESSILKQTGPAGVVKGATELRADGRSVIILFEGADPTTVLHEVAHILRRHVLDQDDMNAITGWLASRGVNVSHQYGEFVGTPDEIEKAEEFFAKAFEQYALEGAAPTPLLQSAFDTLKQAVAQVYLGVADPVIGVKLQPEVRRVFDGLVATVDDQPNATLKQVLRRELLGTEDDSAEGFLNVLSREAQRKGMPRTALEDLQKQFETAKKNRVPADQTYVSFPAPVLGKRDWSFDDLAEFQAARTTEREIDAARKKGIFLDLSGKGMGTASVVEKGAVEELRAYFAYNKDIDDVNKVRGKAKAVVRVVLATFFGGDVVAERGGAQNLLRRAPPEFRQAIDAAERPIEQAIGDTITLVNDAIETNKRTELYRYLGGAGNVRRVAGRPILSAGHDYMGSVIGMIRRSIDDLKPEEKAALETLAEAINSPNRSAALVKLGFDPKSGNTLASVDASVVATREAASRAMSKILFSSKDANADFGASLASAIRGAVEAPANIARPTHEMLLVENLTYIAGLTERNGALFQGTSQDAVKVLLEGDGVRKGVAQIYDEDSARRMAIVIGGFGSSVVGKDTMVKLNLGIDADTYRAFVNWTNGQAWDFQYTEAIQRVVDRYGYNVEFVRDAVLDTDFYIPRLARDRMAESLARSSYRPSATVTGGDAFNILYRYMKKRMTRGSFFIRQRYYMMNTVDHFMQMAMTAGFGTAAASVSRVLVQDVMVLPFWQQIVDFVARRLPGGQRIPADILERFRAGLQVYGDRAANSVATIFSVGKYRIEVNPILEGLDGGFQAGGKVFSYRQIRDIAVQEGIFASFDTRQLASVIEREGALFAAPTLTGVSAAGTAGGGIIPAGLRNFMADWEKTVSETAEAWGERERLGAMITLMEAGHDPRTAARLTIDALYDYSQSMTKADRSMLVGIMFPFWAFQKNANAQVFNNIFSPWGAYRLMVLKRARERGAELLTEVLYNDVGGEYGLDVKSMPPELQESYYAIVTAFEDSFNGQEPPEDAKRALKMLLTGRGRLIEEGKLAMLSPELKRLSDIGATADLQRFAEYTALPPSAAGRQSYLRDRTGVAMLFPRTKAVQMYYRLAGDDHSYMELFIPESSIEAGMRHHTQLAATYMLLSASALDLLPGIDLKEGGLDEVKALNVLKPITDPARSPILAPLLSGTATGELAAPKRVSRRLAETAGLVTQVHPFIGKMMDDMYGTTFVRVPAIKDPFATDFEGNLIEVSEQAAAEMRELQKQFPDAAVLRDQRYYLPGGVWTTALENSPLGELNALLLRYEANPLERNDIRGEILSWARGAAGVDVELISPQKTIKREEPKKLKETPGTR